VNAYEPSMNPFPPLLACATCLADPTSDVGRASSMAILFMVGIVFAMLGVLLVIMFNFARRQSACDELSH
ncbi:MAG: hypothetical protein ACOYOF_19485, partial [Verrucomicrobiaceae bacterium]